MHACLSILFVLLLAHTSFAATNEEAIAAFQQGQSAMQRNAPREAVPLFESSLRICTELGIVPCRTVNLNQLSNAYAMLGRHGEALAATQEVLRIRRQAGAPAEETIRLLDTVGQLQYALGRYNEALAAFEEGLAMSRRLGIKGAVAMLLEGAGMTQFSLNRLDRALSSFQESLQLQREMGYPAEESVRNLNNIGAAYMSGKQYQRALTYLEQALAVFRAAGNQDALATGLNNLGYALSEMRMSDRAQHLYDEALAIRRKIGSPLETATVLNNMGLMLVSAGRYDQALSRHDEALAIRRNANDPKAVAESLTNIGYAHYQSGDYDQAIRRFDEALKIYEGLGDKRILATGLNNLAAVYGRLGRYDRALQCHERSLQLRRELNIPADTALTLNNIGQMHHELGNYDKAIGLFTESLQLKRLNGLPAESIANTLNNIGAVYDATGQPDRALQFYNDALTINRRLDLARAVGNNLSNIGAAYLNLKRYHEAERAFIEAEQQLNRGDRKVRGNPGLVELYLKTGRHERALELLKRMAPDWATDTATRMQFHTQLGAALKGLGRLPEATGELLQAVALVENTRRTVAERGGYFAGGYAGGRIQPYRLLLSVLCERTLKGDLDDKRLGHLGRNTTESAFRVAELIKSRNLLESMAASRRNRGTRQLPEALGRRERSLLNRLNAMDEQWETAVRSGEAAVQAHNQAREKLYGDFIGLIRTLRSRYPQYAAMYYPDAVAASALPLKPDETVLEYAYGDGALYLFVVTKGGVKTVIRIPVAPEELERRVRVFLEPLYANRPEAFSESQARQLGETLMSAAQLDLKQGSRVIIVPDGLLGLLPFGTLRPAMGNNDYNPVYLDDRWLITYEHSASTLALSRTVRMPRATRLLFALGNPVFDRNDPRYRSYRQERSTVEMPSAAQGQYAYRGLSVQPRPAAGNDGRTGWGEIVYQPLPETETEVLAIAATMGVRPVPPDVLLGALASKGMLMKTRLSDYRHLHFATHADLPGKVQGVGEPFILLGQALDQEQSDVFLTLSEIADLQLHADMVMLSACNTGKGDLVAGEGLANLARAFQHAGARSVVSSLWQVASEPAVEYMQSFYRHLRKKNSRAMALSLARREIRKKYDSPFYWSVFVLYGEGGR
ncbi:MAG TPA: tetratricopeptide repeat protein [Deltaproteobacteria bacterium]|nr:tetratricopeptide repeat protein [Deltaproteobacteria bacterium]